MTKEQYQRACEINARLKQLEQVKKEIYGTATKRLTYSYKYSTSSDYSLCNPCIMSYIGAILDKHDEMIRAEICAEIAALEQEIESL
ncbi:MAG: hypothetical protein IKU15_07975 [Clostridia bacterium]|nr:hypothetical protein [Clostridia bacterium]